ncbi:MAG: hypothetical protein IPM98_13345 [Lewinellaceae bacterium]|nr:hypothetical protein [Lewinellaceae bacterium]
MQHASHGTYWKVTTRDNVVTLFGRDSKPGLPTPADPAKIFEWLPEFSYDDKGNWIRTTTKRRILTTCRTR